MRDITEVFTQMEAFTTADEIAAFLGSQNIRGSRGNYSRCPLAVYVTKETGFTVRAFNQYYLWEGGEEAHQSDIRCRTISHRGTCDYTLAEHEFISNFNGTAYPELEEESK